VRLVLQCAMCGTHHPVGTPVCTTCRASGVAQMRLMFECPTCGHLGINPVCEACPFIEPLDLDDDLIIAEEIIDEPIALDPAAEEEDFDLDLDFDEDDTEDEVVIMDLSEESLDDDEEGEDDSDLDDSDLDDLDNEFEEDEDLYEDFEDESDEDFEDEGEEEEDEDD
jgi:hypothetical protein